MLADNIYGPRAGYSKYNHGSLHFEQIYFNEILNESQVSEFTIKSTSFWSTIQENELAKNKYDLIVCSSDFFLDDGNEFLPIKEKHKIFSKKQLEDFETFILAEDCSEETLRFLSIFNLLKKGVNSKFLMIDFEYLFTYGRDFPNFYAESSWEDPFSSCRAFKHKNINCFIDTLYGSIILLNPDNSKNEKILNYQFEQMSYRDLTYFQHIYKYRKDFEIDNPLLSDEFQSFFNDQSGPSVPDEFDKSSWFILCADHFQNHKLHNHHKIDEVNQKIKSKINQEIQNSNIISHRNTHINYEYLDKRLNIKENIIPEFLTSIINDKISNSIFESDNLNFLICSEKFVRILADINHGPIRSFVTRFKNHAQVSNDIKFYNALENRHYLEFDDHISYDSIEEPIGETVFKDDDFLESMLLNSAIDQIYQLIYINSNNYEFKLDEKTIKKIILNGLNKLDQQGDLILRFNNTEDLNILQILIEKFSSNIKLVMVFNSKEYSSEEEALDNLSNLKHNYIAIFGKKNQFSGPMIRFITEDDGNEIYYEYKKSFDELDHERKSEDKNKLDYIIKGVENIKYDQNKNSKNTFQLLGDIKKGQNQNFNKIHKSLDGVSLILKDFYKHILVIKNDDNLEYEMKIEKTNKEFDKLEQNTEFDYSNHFEDIWVDLEDKSRVFISNSALIHDTFVKHNVEDFSPCILLHCRSLEIELLSKIFRKFCAEVNKMETEKIDECLAWDANGLGSKTKKEFETTEAKIRELLKKKKTTLGTMYKIINHLPGDKKEPSQLFKMMDVLQILLDQFGSVPENLSKDLEKLVNEFRNPSAHEHMFSKEQYEEFYSFFKDLIIRVIKCI